jgi:hypothetical protein
MSFLQTAEAWQSNNPNKKMVTVQSIDRFYLIVGVVYPTCLDLGKENLQKFGWVESSVEDGFMIVFKEAKSEDEKEKGGGEEEERDQEEREKKRLKVGGEGDNH